MEQLEERIQCPYCWQFQIVLIDPSEPVQEYVQDCEVCCRPIEFHVVIDGAGVVSLTVEEE